MYMHIYTYMHIHVRLYVHAAVSTFALCVRVLGRAAGATWTSRTTSAQWAGRRGHSIVIDAAGAIYVIGGQGSGGIDYNDVWVSTDGGARAGLRRWSGCTTGVLKGARGVLGCTKGVCGVLEG
jgi:hypothetical protein